MFTTSDKPTVYFDVDSTLVFTRNEAPRAAMRPVWLNGREFFVHEAHVESIADFKARGHNVIVWSQGGAAWAKTVVDALFLGDKVDACLSKPYWYFDDKPSAEWMPEGARSYVTVK